MTDEYEVDRWYDKNEQDFGESCFNNHTDAETDSDDERRELEEDWPIDGVYEDAFPERKTEMNECSDCKRLHSIIKQLRVAAIDVLLMKDVSDMEYSMRIRAFNRLEELVDLSKDKEYP